MRPDAVNTEYLLSEAREGVRIEFLGGRAHLDGWFSLGQLEQLVEHIKVYGYKEIEDARPE